MIRAPRFKRHVKFLKQLRDTRSSLERLRLLSRANPNQIFAIMDAAYNILNGRFPITGSQRNRLIPFRNTIRHLIRARTEKKARYLIQSGGGAWLPALLAPVLAELAPYVIKKIVKAVSNRED